MKRKILLSICALFLITGCFNSKSSSKNVKVDLNKTKGISYDYVLTNDSVILSITNDTDSIIDFINVDMAIYDKSGSLIGVEKQSVRNLESKKTNIIKILYTGLNNDTKPAKVEIATSKVDYETDVETSYTDKVEGTIEKSETENQFNLVIKNNSGVTLNDLSAMVVFYKDSKIVDVYAIGAQEVGEEYTDTVYLPVKTSSDGTTEYIDYDDVKVNINNASTYNVQ